MPDTLHSLYIVPAGVLINPPAEALASLWIASEKYQVVKKVAQAALNSVAVSDTIRILHLD